MFFKNCNYVYMLISIIRSCHTIAYERKLKRMSSVNHACIRPHIYSKIFKHAYLAVYMHPYATVCLPCLKRIQPMPNDVP